jgi:hypothetical protein
MVGNNKGLINAASAGDYTRVGIMLKNGADIHAENEYAFRIAAQKGHHKCMKLLIKSGANIHAKYKNILRNAAYNKHYNCIKLLIEKCTERHTLTDISEQLYDEYNYMRRTKNVTRINVLQKVKQLLQVYGVAKKDNKKNTRTKEVVICEW